MTGPRRPPRTPRNSTALVILTAGRHRFTSPTPLSTRRLLRADHPVGEGITLSVLIAVWEFECCALSPVIGASLTCSLTVATDGTENDDAPGQLRSTWIATSGGPSELQLVGTGVTAIWHEPATSLPPQSITVTGPVHGSFHGGGRKVRATSGIVERIRVVTRDPGPSGSDGPRWRYHDVGIGPRTFRRPESSTRGPEEIAVLVDLHVL